MKTRATLVMHLDRSLGLTAEEFRVQVVDTVSAAANLSAAVEDVDVTVEEYEEEVHYRTLSRRTMKIKATIVMYLDSSFGLTAEEFRVQVVDTVVDVAQLSAAVENVEMTVEEYEG